MRRGILILSKSLGILALRLLIATPFLGQSVAESPNVKHYGYSGTDKLLECIGKAYSKPVARFPYIRQVPDFPCPATKEGIIDLLEGSAFPNLLRVPKGGPSGIRLFETMDWIYLVPSLFIDTKPGDPYYNYRQNWKSVRIKTKVETSEDISQAEDKILREVMSRVPEILSTARMVPLNPMDEPGPDGSSEMTVRLRFYTAKLNPDASDSVIAMIDQWPYVSMGRLVYGEIRNGKYQMIWDSPLLNANGNLDVADVNGDGWKEIVWRSATCGAQNCIPQQVVVFDREGREITRQSNCRTGSLGFDEGDGVCAIEGEDIQFTLISAKTGYSEKDQRAPKDIVVANWYGDGKDAIFTLKNGTYVLNKLDVSQYSTGIASERKAEGIKQAVELNEEGTKLMKEGRYQEAAEKFQSAYYANDIALYENNYGFALYKLGQLDSSVWWFKHVIKVDPKRAIAYLNLGDALAKLNRNADARDAYKKYLELAPDSKATLGVQKKLDALPASP